MPFDTTRPALSHEVLRRARPLAVLGMGASYPGPAIGTPDLVDRVESLTGAFLGREAERIGARLRVETRHVCRDFAARHEAARPGDANPDLAARAVRAALDAAGLAPSDLGYLIGHTTTPETLLPSNIAWVADRLGYAGPHAEFRQACTGFANALVMAYGLLAEPDARPVAIVGSETGSLFFDPARAAEDRGQLVNMLQMGDAAAAVVLGPIRPGSGYAMGVIDAFAFGSIGLGQAPGLSLPNDPAAPAREFAHDFAAVLKHGPALFLAGAAEARAAGADPLAATRIIPHQANGRLDEMLPDYLPVDPARVSTHARRVGNTGSAAIWAALADEAARLAPGETVAILGAEATKHLYATFRFRRA